MTREEAIEILKGMKYPYNYKKNKMIISNLSEETEALEMAISALEQEPCDDAISRNMALEKMTDYVVSGYADSVEDFEEYSKIICQLPSVSTTKNIVNHGTMNITL